MRFPDPPRRRAEGSIVPMINVVFLLLIFFLMTAEIAPPAPFEVAPPTVEAEGDPAQTELVLYLAEDGTLAFQDARGPDALNALQAVLADQCAPDACAERSPPLTLSADGAVDGIAVARLMRHLARIGFSEIQLVTVGQ